MCVSLLQKATALASVSSFYEKAKPLRTLDQPIFRLAAVHEASRIPHPTFFPLLSSSGFFFLFLFFLVFSPAGRARFRLLRLISLCWVFFFFRPFPSFLSNILPFIVSVALILPSSLSEPDRDHSTHPPRASRHSRPSAMTCIGARSASLPRAPQPRDVWADSSRPRSHPRPHITPDPATADVSLPLAKGTSTFVPFFAARRAAPRALRRSSPPPPFVSSFLASSACTLPRTVLIRRLFSPPIRFPCVSKHPRFPILRAARRPVPSPLPTQLRAPPQPMQVEQTQQRSESAAAHRQGEGEKTRQGSVEQK